MSRAIEDLKADKIDVLIPMPVNKESMRAAGVDFSNHTEYLAKAFGTNQHSELFVNGLMRLCYVSKATNVSQVAKLSRKMLFLKKSLR